MGLLQVELNGGVVHLTFLGREQGGLETVHSHKRGPACGRQAQGVVGISDRRQMAGPGRRLLNTCTAEGCLQVLVHLSV